MDDIQFIVDDLQEENNRELQEIMHLLQHPTLQRDAYALRQFTRALLHVSLHKEQPDQKPFLFPEVKITGSSLQVRRPVLQPSHYEPAIPPAPEIPQPVPRPSNVPPFPNAGLRLPEEPRHESFVVLSDSVSKQSLVAVEVTDQYWVQEPLLFPPEQQLLELVFDQVRQHKVGRDGVPKVIEQCAQKMKLSVIEEVVRKVRYFVIRDVFRLGKIEPLLHDKFVAQISCGKAGDPVRVVWKHESLPSNVVFIDEVELDQFIAGLLAKTYKGESKPLLDYAVGNLRIQVQRKTKFASPKFTISKLS